MPYQITTRDGVFLAQTMINISSIIELGAARCPALFYTYMQKNNDEERWSQLMRHAQQGDEAAYRQLLTELNDSIRSFLIRQFGAFALIDDCIQESLLAVHTARHTYLGSKPFKPWLNALVRNKTIDCLRRQNRHILNRSDVDPASDDGDAVTLASSGTTNRSIEDYVSGAQLLAALDRPNRDALIYTKLLGWSVNDTARKLETTPAAVKQRVKRAIAKTSQLMEART